MSGANPKTVSATNSEISLTAEQSPPDPDLIGAAYNVMMGIRQLERNGEDRDTAVETTLDELCMHLSNIPAGLARQLLVTALLRFSIMASVGIQGTARTIAVLNDMTDNLGGPGAPGIIN